MCMEGVWRLSGGCLEAYEKGLEDVWMVIGWCLVGVWMAPGGSLGGV